MARDRTPEHSVDMASGEKFAIVWSDAGTPLQKNNEFIMKTGAVGTVMNFCLSTYYGPINLVKAKVTTNIKNTSTGELCVTNGECQLPRDPFTNKGIAAYVFDDETGNLPPGDYQMEFMVVWANGKTEYYPTGEFINFAKLTIKPNLTR